MSQVEELGHHGQVWIVMAGGKYDFTAKWWNPASYQAVVDHFAGRLQFVQCGDRQHWHPQLRGVINLVGRTDIRQFVRLMYHATGVLCPVTFAMHLAAAVETKAGMLPVRPCVVIGGGREPPHWEAYSHHQYIGNVGTMSCCRHGGCWKSRCQPVGDQDAKDQDLCPHPVAVAADLKIARCMEMIRAEDVIRRIEMYYEGGLLCYGLNSPAA
jgi:ADP-heptose:LPS heptosyltransferase